PTCARYRLGARMQTDQMKRREFMTVLAGAAAAWPLAARAQQSAMPVIGFLRSTSLAVSTPMVTGFRQGLTAAGVTEGQNVAIEYRYADNQRERLPGLVAELIRLPAAVIVANNIAAVPNRSKAGKKSRSAASA